MGNLPCISHPVKRWSPIIERRCRHCYHRISREIRAIRWCWIYIFASVPIGLESNCSTLQKPWMKWWRKRSIRPRFARPSSEQRRTVPVRRLFFYAAIEKSLRYVKHRGPFLLFGSVKKGIFSHGHGARADGRWTSTWPAFYWDIWPLQKLLVVAILLLSCQHGWCLALNSGYHTFLPQVSFLVPVNPCCIWNPEMNHKVFKIHIYWIHTLTYSIYYWFSRHNKIGSHFFQPRGHTTFRKTSSEMSLSYDWLLSIISKDDLCCSISIVFSPKKITR